MKYLGMTMRDTDMLRQGGENPCRRFLRQIPKGAAYLIFGA
ncbi:hypothetical protein [Octadecabacter antarcticus]